MKIVIMYLALIYIIWFNEVSGHGRLMEPPNRSSLWRFKQFAAHNPPVNYNDNELFCGGYMEQYVRNAGRCGACGDGYEDPAPRKNENGGLYGRGVIVRNYTVGQKIPIEVELTRSHLGYFEFQLCYLPTSKSIESELCFGDKLQLSDTLDTKYHVSNMTIGYFNMSIILPRKPCERCVLRWHYRTGNSWGECGNGTSALGCGNQEIFRGCSDVTLHPSS